MTTPLGMTIGAVVGAADAGEFDPKATTAQASANKTPGKTRTSINQNSLMR
jgi:hypothetical protein